MPYNIWCIILGGGNQAFSININEDENVDGLKRAIKTAWPSHLDGIDAGSLTLYKVNIDISTDELYYKAMLDISQSSIECEKKELTPVRKLSNVFEDGPCEDMLHILALPPRSSLNKRKRSDTIDESASIPSILIFYVHRRGEKFGSDTLDINHITQSTDPTTDIVAIKDKLQAKRLISTDEADLLRRANPFIKMSTHFETSTEEGNARCSANELAYYGTLSQSPSFPLLAAYRSQKQGFSAAYFAYLSSYLVKIRSGNFRREKTWPLAMVAQVYATNERYSYRARSDFLFSLGQCPFILFEICSDEQESDRYRALLQAGVLVRVVNPMVQQPFVAVVVYVDAAFVATRYLVYQPDKYKMDINYVKDEFRLENPEEAFQFFFEFYNLPSAFPNFSELSGTGPALSRLLKQVLDQGFGGFTGTGTGTGSKKKPKQDEPTPNNTNTAPDGSAQFGGGPSAAHWQLTESKYRVPPWTPLPSLPPTLRRAMGPTGKFVMLKLVDSEEFAIHSFLDGIKSRDNHIIPILDAFVLGGKAIIAMPHELALPLMPDSIFETKGNDLAYQFLEGVQFMHQRNVAHLDLKPDNIVVAQSTRMPQLCIIDLGVSVQVPEQESWIEGYRGTEGWAAPELVDDPKQKYQPIRADLWSVGRVLRYLAHRQRTEADPRLQKLANELLSHDPLQRPLLSKINTHDNEPQTLKRKLIAGEREEEGKRMRGLFQGDPNFLVSDPITEVENCL